MSPSPLRTEEGDLVVEHAVEAPTSAAAVGRARSDRQQEGRCPRILPQW
jgi:hypothetical protein